MLVQIKFSTEKLVQLSFSKTRFSVTHHTQTHLVADQAVVAAKFQII